MLTSTGQTQNIWCSTSDDQSQTATSLAVKISSWAVWCRMGWHVLNIGANLMGHGGHAPPTLENGWAPGGTQKGQGRVVYGEQKGKLTRISFSLLLPVAPWLPFPLVKDVLSTPEFYLKLHASIWVFGTSLWTVALIQELYFTLCQTSDSRCMK